MEKRWWARVVINGNGYGDCIPTPCTDLEDAQFYIRSVRMPPVSVTYNWRIVEWFRI